MFDYLLSPRRRNCQPEDSDDWVKKAIFGSEVLNPAVQTVIGHPIHYLSPLEVYEIHDKLEKIDPQMLGAHWNPVAMSRAGVYKIHPEQSDDFLSYLQELFGQFKAFYAVAAGGEEGVLTFVS